MPMAHLSRTSETIAIVREPAAIEILKSDRNDPYQLDFGMRVGSAFDSECTRKSAHSQENRHLTLSQRHAQNLSARFLRLFRKWRLPRNDDVGFRPIPNSTLRRINLLHKFKCRIMQVRSIVPRQLFFLMPYQKPYTATRVPW